MSAARFGHVALFVLALVAARPGSGASLADLTRELAENADYKVRLSAALSLGRARDKAAVPALLGALGDQASVVRSVAASALAELSDRRLAPELRARAARELGELARTDPEATVRAAAEKAVAVLAEVERLARPRPLERALFISVAPLEVGATGVAEAAARELADVARDSVLAAHQAAVVEWPKSAAPTAKELKKAKVRGAFNLRLTLSSLTVRDDGKRAAVACELKLVLSTYPEDVLRTFFRGGAEVDSSKRPEAIDSAKVRCVDDLLRHLINSEVGPGLEAAIR